MKRVDFTGALRKQMARFILGILPVTNTFADLR
jgi:hypothetical protein